MGCEYGQGYLLARPMPWQDGQRLLRTNRPLTPAPRVAARSAAG
jgi:EAL domain-containing protein (putative c-di-GMP-specific phosphodiesterase class I)